MYKTINEYCPQIYIGEWKRKEERRQDREVKREKDEQNRFSGKISRQDTCSKK